MAGLSTLTSDPRRELPVLWLPQGPVAAAVRAVSHLLLQQLGDEAVEAVLRGGGDPGGGRGQVQLCGVHARAVHTGEGHLAEIQSRHGGRGGARDVPHQLVVFHPLLQPLEGAVTLPGVSEEVEATQEVDGLENGEGKRGEVVAVQVERDETGQVRESAFFNVTQLVPVQIQDLQLHQVTEPGLGNIDQLVPTQIQHLEAHEALKRKPGQITQQVIIEVEILQSHEVLEGLFVDHVDTVLLEVQVPETAQKQRGLHINHWL